MERKTPLYQTHVDAGGKIVEFGGFLMPVQYPTGVLAEHMAVRQKAGLFDVSHMGELRLKGPDAVANVQKLITADISTMQDGDIKYAMFCNDAGGILDDFIVYRCAADDYWLVVNAGNRDKDAAWVESHLFGDVDYRDEGDDWGQVALQGPKSGDILKKLCAEQYIPAKYYTFIDNVPLDLGSRTIHALVSQTGYTGEYGFEIYCKAEDTVDLWHALLAAGEEYGLIPCGLGARDTLRLEMGYCLYGNDIDDTTSPVEAGLGWITKTGGDRDFIDRPLLERQKREGVSRRLVGFELTERGVPRHGYRLSDAEGRAIGSVTSGTMSPTLKKGIGMGYVETAYAEPGTPIAVVIREKPVAARIVKLPFIPNR